MVKVSIIMPVYNGERFLQAAIDSTLKQTYSSWELIIVNDGSTDSTPQILNRINDSHIVVVHKKNGGEASARNEGLAHANGEYVSFLDADDLYLPNTLADMTDFLEQHPEYDVVYSDGYLCDENDIRLSRLSDHRIGIYTGNILETIVLTAGVIISIGCTMLRRSIITDNHVRFDTQFVIGPDWDFWIQVARFAKFGYLDKITSMYRVHLSNITRTSGVNRRREDLIHGREKVMHSDWFSSLSESTKHKFFYNLLMNLASGQVERQIAFMNEPTFQQLPAKLQAVLVRQVGIDIFRKNGDLTLAGICFRKAERLNPSDNKTKLMINISKLGQKPLKIVLRGWNVLHRFVIYGKGIGRKKPKPAPSQLGPIQG